MGRDLKASTGESSRLGVTPLRLHIEHPEYGKIAYIVIETGFWRRAVGGVRMLPDVTEEHVADLARAMTYKFAFLNMPCTGAKGGIVSTPSWLPNRKDEILQFIGKSVAQLIHAGLYTPGSDLGFGMSDCWAVLRGAGIATPDRRPDDWMDAESSPGYATGLTVFVTADEALASLGMTCNGATVAVEGFGKVGAAAAMLFADAGATVTAVSTLRGAIYASNGLDIGKLLALRAMHGDDAVLQYDAAESISHQDLLGLPVDVLCPCAGQWTIGPENQMQLNCKVISSGSNCSIDPKIREEITDSDSILVMPDFIASSGSVLVSNLMGSDAVRRRVVQYEFRQAVQGLIAESRRRRVSLTRLAKGIAEGNLDKARSQPGKARRHERAHRLASRMDEFAHTPTRLRDSMSRYFARRWLPASHAGS
jgi:glutamate dehydrogenase (NAD(P)+)